MSSLQPFIAPMEYARITERDDVTVGVTVVIPCYKQADTLVRTVRSVLDQTSPAYEIIVIDDGTPDDAVFRAVQDLPVRYVWVTNRGLSAARNTGLMLTKTVGFLPIDSDDWIEPTYIEKTLPLLVDGADVVLTGIQEHGETRNGRYMPGYDRPYGDVTADLILDEYNRFFYCSLFRSEMLRSVGGYNPKMHRGLEDCDLWVDLLRRGACFAAVEEALFNYTTNPNGMLQTIHRDGGYDEMMSEMRRHHAVSCGNYLARS